MAKYKLVSTAGDSEEKIFATFTEAKKAYDNDVEGWSEFFIVENVSRVMCKLWHKCSYGGYLPAGMIYIKKIND